MSGERVRSQLKRVLALIGAVLAAAAVALVVALPVGEKAAPLLPGSTLTDIWPLRDPKNAAAVVVEAVEAPQAEDLADGWHWVARQEFRVIQPIWGEPDRQVIFVSYRYTAPQEEPIARGRRVIWVVQANFHDTRICDGVKAYADTEESRKIVEAATCAPQSEWPYQSPMLLPGSDMTLGDAIHRRSRIVALCQAKQFNGMDVNSLAGYASQGFKVLQVFQGEPETPEVIISYVVNMIDERPIETDEQVLWIAEPMLAKPQTDDPLPPYPVRGPKIWWYGKDVGTLGPADNVPHWQGLKALRDTPENRRLLGIPEVGSPPVPAKAVAKKPPAAPPAPPKAWTEEEAIRKLGVRQDEPIDSGFVFFDGRYLDAPYTIARRGGGIYINDTPLFAGPFYPPDEYDPEDKPPAAPPGLNRNSTFADLDLPGPWNDSWDRQMVRWIRRHCETPGDMRDDEKFLNRVLEFYKGLPFIKEARFSERCRDELVLMTVRGEEVTIDAGFYGVYFPTLATVVDQLDRFYFKAIEEELRKGDCLFYVNRSCDRSISKDKAAAGLGLMVKILTSPGTEEEKTDLLHRLFQTRYGDAAAFPTLIKRFLPSKSLEERINRLVQETGVKPLDLKNLPPHPDAEPSLETVLKTPGRVVAICQAMENRGSVYSSITHDYYRHAFTVVEMLDGRTDAKEVMVEYTRRVWPLPKEEAFREGDRVILIAGPGPNPSHPEIRMPFWNGLKALADTPENRKRVMDAVKGAAG